MSADMDELLVVEREAAAQDAPQRTNPFKP